METFNTSEINTEIRKHWRKYYSDDKESSFHCWPMQYPNLNKCCLLFVGLNPSLRKEDKKAEKFVLSDGKKSLSNSKDVKRIIAEDRRNRGGTGRTENRFGYPLCGEISERCGFKSGWDYIDPFSNRCLTKDELKNQLGIVGDQEKVSWPPDGSAAEQLEIFKELLDSLKPKAVLVANALASHILIKELRLNLKDTEKGWSHLPSKKTPIFFSRTISGGYMDRWSRRRLIDQIINVTNNH